MGTSARDCHYCGMQLSKADFASERAIRLLGRHFCKDCLDAVTLYCHSCTRPMKTADFDAGRAVTLMGKRYCEGCLEKAVAAGRHGAVPRKSRRATARRSRNSTVRRKAPRVPQGPRGPRSLDELVETAGPDPKSSRRSYDRFIPPSSCDLILKRHGIGGLFGGNRVRLWLDVSERGCRAIVEGKNARRDTVQLWIHHRGMDERFDVTAEVRHVKKSEKYPGCFIAGFKFMNPSPVLRMFMRKILKNHPAITPGLKRKKRAVSRGA